MNYAPSHTSDSSGSQGVSGDGMLNPDTVASALRELEESSSLDAMLMDLQRNGVMAIDSILFMKRYLGYSVPQAQEILHMSVAWPSLREQS